MSRNSKDHIRIKSNPLIINNFVVHFRSKQFTDFSIVRKIIKSLDKWPKWEVKQTNKFNRNHRLKLLEMNYMRSTSTW